MIEELKITISKEYYDKLVVYMAQRDNVLKYLKRILVNTPRKKELSDTKIGQYALANIILNELKE